jgi:hypothetical protein
MKKKEKKSIQTYNEEYLKALEKYSKLKHIKDKKTGEIDTVFPKGNI